MDVRRVMIYTPCTCDLCACPGARTRTPRDGSNRHGAFSTLRNSMYIPKSFAESDIATLSQFMRDNNFAALVTEHEGQLTASHLPFLIDTERGVLRAHLARANDQWKAFDGREALVIFQGPHAYISPTW